MQDSYIEDLFNEWLKQPVVDSYGDHGTLLENIESSYLSFVKKAFFDGFSKGFETRLQYSYEEQMQK